MSFSPPNTKHPKTSYLLIETAEKTTPYTHPQNTTPSPQTFTLYNFSQPNFWLNNTNTNAPQLHTKFLEQQLQVLEPKISQLTQSLLDGSKLLTWDQLLFKN